MTIDPNKAISYEPETGVFKWKVSSGRCKPDSIAGTIGRNGYRYIKCGGRVYLAHRLAYLLMGYNPPIEVDHINGSKDDNRWTNLRPTDRSRNQMNAKIRSDNTSGCKGVSICPRTGHWRAEIWVDGSSINLGTYHTLRDAVLARQDAERNWFGEYAYSRRNT